MGGLRWCKTGPYFRSYFDPGAGALDGLSGCVWVCGVPPDGTRSGAQLGVRWGAVRRLARFGVSQKCTKTVLGIWTRCR